MPRPSRKETRYLILKMILDKKPHRLKEIASEIASVIGLTDEEKTAYLPSRKDYIFNNFVAWAKLDLLRAGFIESTGWGQFKITDLGLEIFRASTTAIEGEIINKYIDLHPEEKEDAGVEDATIEEGSDVAPEEILSRSYEQIQEKLKIDLLENLKNMSPKAFEQLALTTLKKLGYGGQYEPNPTPTGGPKDKGIDGTIREDTFGLSKIYVQAKHYTAGEKISRAKIGQFAGDMLALNAKKGVFITLSKFTPDAKDQAIKYEAEGRTVKLIDGEELLELMIKNNLGVNITQVFELKAIDEGYFEDLQQQFPNN